MSFSLTLYTFSKRRNSTATPASSTGTPFTISLKDPCSVIRPEILLVAPATPSPAGFNYAYMEIFDRYYYITDWQFIEGIWHAFMAVDVMATYKPQIGAASAYILRAASGGNGRIVDTMYPTIEQHDYDEYTRANPWTLDPLAMSYVVGVKSSSTQYLEFSYGDLESFLADILDDDYIDALIPNWEEVYPQARAEVNPLQYISSIIAIPLPPRGGGSQTVRVGRVSVDAQCYPLLNESGIVRHVEVTFPVANQHPQLSRGQYLQLAPYSIYSMFIPPFGLIPLDSAVMAGSENGMVCDIYIDVRDGDAAMHVNAITSGGQRLISVINSRVGIDAQYSQVVSAGYSMLQLGVGISSIIGSAVNWPAASSSRLSMVAGATSGISNVINTGMQVARDATAAQIPSASTVGNSSGGYAALQGICALQIDYYSVTQQDNTHNGTPVMAQGTFSSMPGFILPHNARIAIPGTLEEHDEVEGLVNGGFYYE